MTYIYEIMNEIGRVREKGSLTRPNAQCLSDICRTLQGECTLMPVREVLAAHSVPIGLTTRLTSVSP
jgi:hypothetical protein